MIPIVNGVSLSHSLSLSSIHRPDMTEILLKRTLKSISSIHLRMIRFINTQLWKSVRDKITSKPRYDKNNKVALSSLWVLRIAKNLSYLSANSSGDSDQNGRKARLIRVFAGRICHFVARRRITWLILVILYLYSDRRILFITSLLLQVFVTSKRILKSFVFSRCSFLHNPSKDILEVVWKNTARIETSLRKRLATESDKASTLYRMKTYRVQKK